MIQEVPERTTRPAPYGLSAAQAAARLARDGGNVLPDRPRVRPWRRVLSQLRDPLIRVLLLGPPLGLALPLLPAQLLWINLLTHGLPGVALGSEPVDPDAMRQPPRSPTESVLGAGLWQRIVRVGAVIAAVTLGVAVWAHAAGHPWQSMAFLALGATQLAVALGSRARPGTWTNPMLLGAVAGALGLQVAGVYLPPLRSLLGTQPLSPLDLVIVGATAPLGYAAVRLDRLIRPARSGSPRTTRVA